MLLDALAQGSSEWMGSALCRLSRFPDLWFPPKGAGSAAAKGVCSRCPVRGECLEYAIDNEIDDGIWGGESGHGRRRIVRERRRAAA